jgi:DNA-directed RNA polymerase subunit beta
MEVWALEAYAAANILQEMITIKSDDVAGRTQAYEAIVKNTAIRKPNIPESFNVLIKELQAINLDVTLLDKHELKQREDETSARFEEILKIEAKVMSEKAEVKETKATAKKAPKTTAKKEEIPKIVEEESTDPTTPIKEEENKNSDEEKS